MFCFVLIYPNCPWNLQKDHANEDITRDSLDKVWKTKQKCLKNREVLLR